ncbi:hypothetical protein SAMN02910291_02259 [Desulfovibrio desulfuricans]|uniref:Uncharacterized protein n=2 Tax=Desulfovibrionaceae TaxID=194924 RepID=A0AA94L2Z5_DESDE|nr:hypothetical protein CNY67_05570 [Desulfovibrio sp. G11]SFW64413.1 hypothetical protein SAMN02910291_02259 [Desulfovibrio desulfuricans]SPD36496.1 Hypothetical protein DSVG11_2454 [Desulfovibrio sp. G11]
MAGQEILHEAVNQDVRVKELTEENELLFEQLHVVQEELEKYYHKLKECEQQRGSATSYALCNSRLPEVLAENQKLRVLADWQQRVLHVETQNSLPSRLGDILIKGVSSTGAFLALPGKLRKMWKALDQTTPPSELGGKSFPKVIDVYSAGGAEAVEKLLDSIFISHPMRANAYTALARHLMLIDVQKAAEFARLAYETDPRPYRLKWLAFRRHDADDPITADAMLDLLPADITMSESEQRQVMRIRHESTQLRKKNAEKDANVQKQKNTENQNIVQLTKQVEELRREAERLRQQQKELQNTADVRQADLKATQANLTEQKVLVELRDAEVGAMRSAQAELQALADGYKAEAEALQVRLAEQEMLVENQKNEIVKLKLEAEVNSIYTSEQKEKVLQLESIKSNMNSEYANLQKIYFETQVELKSNLEKQISLAHEKANYVMRIHDLQKNTDHYLNLSGKMDKILDIIMDSKGR